ncbi:hypothetical protein J1N35_036606 [Gossypium stocksii]|uniref:Uncharacterized protein n=1 Tax=Gossypium stocksii TaxID=47602 RepID=A0A9D3UI91_9ROSI|nr:hypothetical protein J1N35_036606 [Gossypium stocksii]
MESVQLEHENITEFVLVTFRDRVEEGRRSSNEEKDPMTSKELNVELYEVKISCAAQPGHTTVWSIGDFVRNHRGVSLGHTAM